MSLVNLLNPYLKDDIVCIKLLSDTFCISYKNGTFNNHYHISIYFNHFFYNIFNSRCIKEIFLAIVVSWSSDNYKISIFITIPPI